MHRRQFLLALSAALAAGLFWPWAALAENRVFLPEVRQTPAGATIPRRIPRLIG